MRCTTINILPSTNESKRRADDNTSTVHTTRASLHGQLYNFGPLALSTVVCRSDVGVRWEVRTARLCGVGGRRRGWTSHKPEALNHC